MSDEQTALYGQAVHILKAGVDMTIATNRPDGFPQATTVSYVSDGLTIYFGCDPAAQKATNIARDNRVSLTVNLPYDDWSGIEGLSMAALATQVTDPAELDTVRGLFLKKFPQVGEIMPDGANKVAAFRITPQVISVLDYTKGFGHTALLQVA